MDDTLGIGWTQGRARSRRSGYQRLLRLALLAEGALAAVALIAPHWLAYLAGPGGWADGAPDAGWVRTGGILIFLFILFQVPGLADPVRKRWPNIVGILGRFFLALAFLLGVGLMWAGAAEALLFLLLAVLYYRLFIAELMSRP